MACSRVNFNLYTLQLFCEKWLTADLIYSGLYLFYKIGAIYSLYVLKINTRE